MTISYFVRYDDSVPLSEEFLRHYRQDHAKILKRFPSIQSLYVHTSANWADGESVNAGNAGLLAQLVFPSEAALNEALASKARQLARDDMLSFPSYAGTVVHQAMSSRKIF